MSEEVLNDEMPSAPVAESHEEGGETTAQPIDVPVEASIFDAVPKMGEALPIGTYHMRGELNAEGFTDFKDGTPQEVRDFGKQPYYQVLWKVQQEPLVGRGFMDFVPYVNEETARAAAQGNSTARGIVNDRLWKAKMILEGAGYKPSGAFSFREFLLTNPEMKIQLKVVPRKQKDASGKYVATGENGNQAVHYIPLVMAGRAR